MVFFIKELKLDLYTSFLAVISGAITSDSLLINKMDPFFKNINFLSVEGNFIEEFSHFFISSYELCEL